MWTILYPDGHEETGDADMVREIIEESSNCIAVRFFHDGNEYLTPNAAEFVGATPAWLWQDLEG